MVLLLVVPAILQEAVGGNAAWLLLRFLRSFLAGQEAPRRRHPANRRTGLSHEMLLLPRGKLLSGSAQESVPPLISHGPLGRDSFPQGKPFYRQALILAVMV